MIREGSPFKTKSFAKIDSRDYFGRLSNEIRAKIEGENKGYILGIEEDEYIKHLVDEYTLQPLEIDKSKEHINKPSSKVETYQDPSYGGQVKQEYYHFKIEYPFTGTPSLFRVRPSRRKLTTEEIIVNPSQGSVAIEMKIAGKDPDKFGKQKSRMYNNAFLNIENVNLDVENWNQRLGNIVAQTFQSVKKKYKEENKFFEEIDVKVDNQTEEIFSVPTVKKKIIPKPEPKEGKSYSSEPAMSMQMYEDVLEIIYKIGKKMERKPSLYQNKDEEEIRDHFVTFLETRYESTTATGETFNKEGRTDIILKYSEDGSNLFIAECKFWTGIKGFYETINQLFDRYLTWRDSKAAIMIFVENKKFSGVIDKITNEIDLHDYYSKNKGSRGDTSYSYRFHFPTDEDKEIYLEVMLFHFPPAN